MYVKNVMSINTFGFQSLEVAYSIFYGANLCCANTLHVYHASYADAVIKFSLFSLQRIENFPLIIAHDRRTEMKLREAEACMKMKIRSSLILCFRYARCLHSIFVLAHGPVCFRLVFLALAFIFTSVSFCFLCRCQQLLRNLVINKLTASCS